MKHTAILMTALLMPFGSVLAMSPPQEPAAAPTAAVVEEAAEPAVDPDKMRCKRMPVTGSRNGKNVCHTEREWAAMENSAQEFMRDIEGQPRRDPRYDGNSSGNRGVPTGE
jgi:hypothetical protein